MAKYYLVSEFTPSQKIEGRDSTFRRIYPRASEGFLFHDTEEALQLSDILRPLHRLSELFEGAKKALVIRHDANTLVATFSLAAFPKPVRIQRDPYKPSTKDYEWLQESGLTGWLIPDVNNPSVPAIACSPDDIFSNCTELVRYTNSCPCPKQDTGECAAEVLYPNLPEGIQSQDMLSDYRIDRKSLKRVRYKTIAGFELTSGGLTADGDFGKAIRPWDNHDFQVVPGRRLELSARGKARHLRAKFRKAQCSKCCFVKTFYYSGETEDCGNIADCKEATDAATAWGLLYHWYSDCGFNNMEGFTAKQRDYLVQAAGRETLIRAICERRTRTIWGGFVSTHKGWCYRLSAAGGDITRCEDIATWKELKEKIPELPDKIEPIHLDSKTKLACAILGTQRHGITAQYMPYRPIYKITVVGSCAEATGAASRYESTSLSLYVNGKHEDVKEYYRAVWGYRFSKAPEWARQRLHLPTV